MKVYKLDKGRIDYKENILNIEQDLPPIMNKLSIIPSKLPVFICRKSNPNLPPRYKNFKINRNNILR